MEPVIAFVSLFLGLARGPQDVGLLVGAGVAQVEVSLDGALVGRLDAPPWSVRCDFGALAPHRLVAVARDRRGVELGHAEQWLNLPRAAAEIAVVVEPGSGGGGLVARISFESLTQAEPTRLLAWLDDVELEAPDPARLLLPEADLDSLHVLHVEGVLADGQEVEADVTFGGFYSEQVSSELSAVPVRAAQGFAPPHAPLDDLVVRAGEDVLPLLAVDAGPPDVLVVRDDSAHPDLEQMLLRELQKLRDQRTLSALSTSDQLRTALPLGNVRLQFQWPFVAQEGTRAAGYELFPHSQWFTQADGGFAWLLSQLITPEHSPGDQRLADAVAVAAIQAAGRNRRRAVVLVLGERPDDHSAAEVAEVRRFLASLQVPLVVWRTAPSSSSAAWGRGVDISRYGRLRRAVGQLLGELESQRVLWVGGRHLPQSLSLDPGASGLALVR